MSDPHNIESDSILNLSDAIADPVKTSFLSATNALIGGGIAILAAWIKQPAQSIEDKTAARSVVAAALAKAVSEEVTKDTAIMQAATQTYLPRSVREARNRIKVAQRAAEQIDINSALNTKAAPPEDDWMNRFMRFAEDASSERLQYLFGRILAGEVVRPGSFSAATLRAVSELDQSLANDFSWAWARSVGDSVDYDPEFQRGEGFSRWKRLNEAGLMGATSIRQFLPPFTPVLNGNGIWSPFIAGETGLSVLFERDSKSRWDHIEFTRVGREIGSLLPSPDYETNIRRAGQRLPKDGIVEISIISSAKSPEIIWKSTQQK